MGEREQWGTRAGFLLAAIGSAIGLGNIWRFPYVAYANGGGAFFVPYLFALVTAGIPLLVLEYTVGHRYRGSTALSWRRMGRRSEFLGWWQVAVSFVIATYYAVVIAWAASYTFFSLGSRWGDDTEAHLMGQYLQVSEAPWPLGGVVVGVFVPLSLIWAVTLLILYRGVAKGIEKATRIMIPLLVAMFGVLVLRAVTLPGSLEGLNALFTPDWSRITDSSVWVSAYGQIFFSLSVGFGIMVVYSSYLPRSSDLTNSAFVAGFANSSFELVAGLGVFSALGFMATQSGTPIQEVATDGVGLAFVVFPQIIDTLPAGNSLFGFLFFASLVVAGLSSHISIVQTFVSALEDKLAMSRRTAVSWGGGTAAVVSLLFATNAGVHLLTAADYFVNNFGIVLIGLVEAVIVAWIYRNLGELQRHANEVSDIRLGRWWPVCIAAITPVVLAWITVDNAIKTFTGQADEIQGYPAGFLVLAACVVALGCLLFGIAMAMKRWDPAVVELPVDQRPIYEEAGS